MTKFILVFLLAHIIGDYYLQTDSMCQKKSNDYKWLLIHSISYTFPFWCALLLIHISWNLILSILILGLSHGIIDLLKIKCFDWKRIHLSLNLTEKKVYIIDQLLHILSIYGVCFIFLKRAVLTPNLCLKEIQNLVSLNLTDATKYTILLLSICKPVNITFSILFSDFKPKKSAQDEDSLVNIHSPIKNAGSYINVI